MATTTFGELNLADFDAKAVTVGKIQLRHYSTGERIFRAAKFFFLFALLAVASAFIPILHFLLVPLFSFIAVGAAAAMVLQTTEVAEALGPCPYCGQTTVLKRALVQGEFRDSCEHCRQLIMVTAGP